MFVHICNKVYFVNKSSEPKIKFQEYITFDYIENYINFKNNFPILEIMYNQLSDQGKLKNKHNGIHVYILSDEDFIKAINDYCSFLNLDYNAIEKIIDHSKMCELYMENCNDISIYNSKFSINNFTIKKYSHIIRYPEIFPAEFFINCINSSIGMNKFTRFRIYELYNLIKNIQYSYIRNNEKIPKELEIFIGNDDNALLLYNNTIFNSVIKTLDKIGINTKKFTVSLEEYINLDPNFGYNQYHIYKYNFALAKYLKDIKYKIIK